MNPGASGQAEIAGKRRGKMAEKLKFAVAGFGDRGYSFIRPLLTPEFRDQAEIVANVADLLDLMSEGAKKESESKA